MQELKRFRAACEQRLRGIVVLHPFSLASFADEIARRRDRPLRICPLPAVAGARGLSGAWIATIAEDRIYIDSGASPWHRDLIGLHEIAHMLWDHDNTLARSDMLTSTLLPDLTPTAVQRILGRGHGYLPGQEEEAEMTAALILERADQNPAPAASATAGDLVARLSDALRHPVRRG